jgi:chromosome segregation ATPase
MSDEFQLTNAQIEAVKAAGEAAMRAEIARVQEDSGWGDASVRAGLEAARAERQRPSEADNAKAELAALKGEAEQEIESLSGRVLELSVNRTANAGQIGKLRAEIAKNREAVEKADELGRRLEEKQAPPALDPRREEIGAELIELSREPTKNAARIAQLRTQLKGGKA